MLCNSDSSNVGTNSILTDVSLGCQAPFQGFTWRSIVGFEMLYGCHTAVNIPISVIGKFVALVAGHVALSIYCSIIEVRCRGVLHVYSV